MSNCTLPAEEPGGRRQTLSALCAVTIVIRGMVSRVVSIAYFQALETCFNGRRVIIHDARTEIDCFEEGG